MAGVPVENASGTTLEVKLTQTDADVGAAINVSQNDDGVVSGAVDNKSPEVSNDFRVRVGIDTILFDRIFNHAAQDTGNEVYRTATMTNGWSPPSLVTNSGSATANNNGASYASWRSFPMFGAIPTYTETALAFSATPTTNTTIDFGLGTIGTGGTPWAPTDGVYFRLTSSGLFGVVNFNGAEIPTSALAFTITTAKVYRFVITTTDRVAQFWIDDVKYGEIARQVGNGTMFQAGSGNFFIRHAIAGGAASGVQQVSMRSWTVSLGDTNTSKPWGHIASGAGRMGYQEGAGGTMGGSASYTNSSNPSGAGGSNSSALVTGLGGQFQLNNAAGATTDFIVTSYQNPAGGIATRVPRNLVVTGVWISAVNFGATVATTPTTLEWSLAFGHTAADLGTVEAATTKKSRRVPLGLMSVAVGALAGTPYAPSIYVPFPVAPVFVAPGEFVQAVAKILTSTNTGSQTIFGVVGFESHWE